MNSDFLASEGVRATVETVLGDQRVAQGVLAANATAIAASQLEIIQGYVSLFSILIGGITTAVVCAVWMVKLCREWAGLRRDLKDERKGDAK